jgi:hypothetical protein
MLSSATMSADATQLEVLRRNRSVYDSLLIGQGGRAPSARSRRASSTTRRQPDLPEQGKRSPPRWISRARRQHQFYKPRSSDLFIAPRDVVRSARSPVHPRHRPTESLPIFERLFLGGEVQRARLRHPLDWSHGTWDRSSCWAGNKSLLFNAEYLISIVNQGCASCSSTTRARCVTWVRASRGEENETRIVPSAGAAD